MLTIWLITFTHQAHAQPDWLSKALKVDDPNQLRYYWSFSGKGCLITEDEAQEIINGVFIRSRIKPKPQNPTGLYLNINVLCIKRDPFDDSYIYHLDVKFGQSLPTPILWDSPTPILFDYSFGYLGLSGKETMNQVIKNEVERAVTAFIKANFDL